LGIGLMVFSYFLITHGIQMVDPVFSSASEVL
jgi:hypothetical protein